MGRLCWAGLGLGNASSGRAAPGGRPCTAAGAHPSMMIVQQRTCEQLALAALEHHARQCPRAVHWGRSTGALAAGRGRGARAGTAAAAAAAAWCRCCYREACRSPNAQTRQPEGWEGCRGAYTRPAGERHNAGSQLEHPTAPRVSQRTRRRNHEFRIMLAWRKDSLRGPTSTWLAFAHRPHCAPWPPFSKCRPVAVICSYPDRSRNNALPVQCCCSGLHPGTCQEAGECFLPAHLAPSAAAQVGVPVQAGSLGASPALLRQPLTPLMLPTAAQDRQAHRGDCTGRGTGRRRHYRRSHARCPRRFRRLLQLCACYRVHQLRGQLVPRALLQVGCARRAGLGCRPEHLVAERGACTLHCAACAVGSRLPMLAWPLL